MQRLNHARIGLTVVAMAALAGCGANAGSGVKQGTTAVVDYYAAKSQMAQTLQKYLTGTTGSTVYTLVAINGPAYPVGTLLADGNPLDVESRACQLQDDELPAAEAWSNVPSAKNDKTFTFSLNIPAPMRRVFQNAESSFGAGLTWSKHSFFEMSQMSQVFLSREDLRTILARPDCAAALKAADGSQAVFVRGIVYGKETLTSSFQFNPNLSVKVMEGETGQFTLNYNNQGAFSLTETSPAPKFAIVARVRAPGGTKSTQGSWDEDSDNIFTSINPETVRRMESARSD